MTASSPAYMRVLPSGLMVWPSRLNITTINGCLPCGTSRRRWPARRPWGGGHGDLAQRNLGTLFERWSGHHQQVTFLDHGVAIGQHRVRTVTKHQDHEHVCGATDVRERASGKRMSSAHLELYKRHAVLVAVVVKGAVHVAGRIDHIELLRQRRQQRALHHNARHGNHKHQVK